MGRPKLLCATSIMNFDVTARNVPPATSRRDAARHGNRDRGIVLQLGQDAGVDSVQDETRRLQAVHGVRFQTVMNSRTKTLAGLARMSLGRPICSIRPIDITTTRSASSMASS